MSHSVTVATKIPKILPKPNANRLRHSNALLSSNLHRPFPLSAVPMSTPPPCSSGGETKRDYAEIVVVRHGETTWNAGRIIQGHMNSELNEAGKMQAESVARRLSKEHKFAAIYSSDLKRAADTASTVASACNLEVILDPAFRERNLGDLQGMTLKDSSKLKPVAYKCLLSSNLDQEIPGGGESVNQLHQRCTTALEIIARKHIGETVLVVTHGGVLRQLYKRAVPRSSSDCKFGNTSVNVFCISSDGNNWKIKMSNDISHLRGTAFLKDSFGGDKMSG